MCIMMLDISQHMVTNEVYSLVTVGSGLARKFVSLVLSSPPHHQMEIYNTTKIFTNLLLIHLSVIIIYNAYLKLGRSKLCCNHLAFRLTVCRACFHHYYFAWPQSERALLSKICLAYLKLTSSQQLISLAKHKVSSG